MKIKCVRQVPTPNLYFSGKEMEAQSQSVARSWATSPYAARTQAGSWIRSRVDLKEQSLKGKINCLSDVLQMATYRLCSVRAALSMSSAVSSQSWENTLRRARNFSTWNNTWMFKYIWGRALLYSPDWSASPYVAPVVFELAATSYVSVSRVGWWTLTPTPC